MQTILSVELGLSSWFSWSVRSLAIAAVVYPSPTIWFVAVWEGSLLLRWSPVVSKGGFDQIIQPAPPPSLARTPTQTTNLNKTVDLIGCSEKKNPGIDFWTLGIYILIVMASTFVSECSADKDGAEYLFIDKRCHCSGEQQTSPQVSPFCLLLVAMVSSP